MIDKETIQYVEPALKHSIKKYFSLRERTLLYDVLLFCSITSQTKMFCSQSDLESFNELLENCRVLSIPIEQYLSCAYAYISKYSTPGHRLGVGYFLNDAVIEYCGSVLDKFNSSSLFLEQIKEDILSTEKTIRNEITTTNCTYDMAFGKLLKLNRISHFFLAYKKFCLSPLVEKVDSEYFKALVEILEPFFTYILAKNSVYTNYKLQKWNNSKIEDFNFCPIFFTDRYITNELVDENLGNEATTQGTKLHKIFETIIERYKKSKTKNLSKIALAYFASQKYLDIKEELSEHTPFIESLFSDTGSILHTLINKDSELFIEHTMTANLYDTNFYGTADLIIINGTKAYVLDWKSSKLDPKYLPKNNSKYNKQISLYAKLLQAERPEITETTGIIIYTRGLVHTFDKLNNNIHIERGEEIKNIKRVLKHGVILPNKASCFLCRHPSCKERQRESIWDAQGNRKK